MWDEFERGLAESLRSVTDRVYLIIAAEADPVRYVQFAGHADELAAEAPSVNVVVDADEAVLAAVGWTPPSALQPNWSTALVRPALTSEYAALAASCVRVLRDAFGVADPAELGYRAWRDGEQMPLGATWSAERIAELDRGEDAVAFPALGLSSDS